MNETILFVDDDPRIVSTLQRALQKDYQIETANDPEDAIKAVLDRQFAVVVSDLNMPRMNGIELLRRVKSLSPPTVGILLTGWADLETAIDAVNEGHIFRFLRKPCPHEILRTALDSAVTQNRLICSEKDILRHTLIGTLTVLIDALATSQPEKFGHVLRIRRLVRDLANQMNLAHLWEIEAAGILSQIGCLSVPSSTLKKYLAGADLSPEEMHQIAGHPTLAYDSLCHVSRLATVASIIRRQTDPFHEAPDFSPENLTILIGSQILRVAIDFERMIGTGLSCREAVTTLRRSVGEYNGQVLDGLERLVRMNASSNDVVPRLPDAFQLTD